MEKVFTKNRSGQKIAILVELAEHQKGLAFVMHGLGGFKEQDHIVAFADAFRERGFTTVRFDTTNSFGESDGNYENATITNYYEDLEDVIRWAQTQSWYREPFILVGHSLGGISTILYAENYPSKVSGLAPISSVISGKLTLSAEPSEKVIEWERTGWKISPSMSKPGLIKKLNWHQFVADSAQHDVLRKADKLTMPVILIVGSEDRGTPYEHQELLFNTLSCKKEIHVIKGAPHTFRDPEHLQEIKGLLSQWVRKNFE